MPWIRTRRSTATARRSCCRANARRRCVSEAPRSRALQRAVDQAMQARIVRDALAQQIEIAHHRHQQIVEIMRDAAGELADGFHLLRLPQLLLRSFARRDFLHQIGGALIDALLQRRRQFRQRGALGRELRQQIFALDLGNLARGDVGRDADQRPDAAIRPPDGARADVDPMLRAVGPDVAVFDAVVLAGFDGPAEHLEAPCAIVGMHRRQQILIGERIIRLAAEKRLAGVGGFELERREDAVPARRDDRR